MARARKATDKPASGKRRIAQYDHKGQGWPASALRYGLHHRDTGAPPDRRWPSPRGLQERAELLPFARVARAGPEHSIASPGKDFSRVAQWTYLPWL